MVPNTSSAAKPRLFSTLPAKVSSTTPICETGAVSLMKAKAGGRITGQARGTITWRESCQRPRFMAVPASICWWGTDSSPVRMISAV